jgi:hypothetical protein
VWRVIVAEDEGAIRALVVIGIYVAFNAVLDIDELAKVQEGTIQEIDATSDKADVGATLVASDTRQMYCASASNATALSGGLAAVLGGDIKS